MIRNVLFIVEGKTEGVANAFGKGLWNILRYECDFMRQQGIRHHSLRRGVQTLVWQYQDKSILF